VSRSPVQRMKSAPRRTASTQMAIRRADAQDLNDLVALEDVCFTDGPYRNHRFDKANYRYHVKNPQSIVLVVPRQERLIGTAVHTLGSKSRSQVGRVISIAVDPNFRRRGIGRMLLDKGIGLLQQRGCRRVYLEVATNEKSARTLFQQAGFKRVRRLPDYYGPGLDGIRMKLDLAAVGA